MAPRLSTRASRDARTICRFFYALAAGGSSISQGHAYIVVILPFVFLITVIFTDFTPEKRVYRCWTG
jgi:hypothetical protein